MNRIVVFTMLVLSFGYTSAQRASDSLVRLSLELENGRFEALLKLAAYTSDTTSLSEFWEHGIINTTVGKKAKGIIEANSLFLPNEFNWNDSTADFRVFLNKNITSLHFDSLAEKFLITPLQKRKTVYKLYSVHSFGQISAEKIIDSIEQDYEDLLDLKVLLSRKDNRSLARIAALFFTAEKHGLWHRELIEQLFQALTNTLVSVQDEEERWKWTYDDDYGNYCRLKLLIYWINHYRDYRWDDKQKRFSNYKEVAAKAPKEMQLLKEMQSDSDSVALKAFTRIIQSHPDTIAQLPVNDFEETMNYSLPIFKTSFIEVLSEYNHYGKQNKINLNLGGRAKEWFRQLAKENLQFKKRYEIENEVIRLATPVEMSALEYWFLISEENWDLTYSAGRIIDKFYSFHWNEIVHNEDQLKAYLKKAALFDRLGIIGNCNKYLKKFQQNDTTTVKRLLHIISSSKDSDIVENAKKVLPGINANYKTGDKINSANYDTLVTDLDRQFQVSLNKLHEDYEHPLRDLISSISYKQIPAVFSLIKKYKAYSEKYDFLENDFGFPVDIDDSVAVNKFLQLYQNHSYEELCRYYLNELGLPYKKPNGSLDYQSIYEMLEFDIVDALSGGGGGRREKGVYLIIKLLEFQFHTTLGFPQKLCNGGGIYGCSSDDRAREWINYLKEKGLVKPLANPLSISPFGG